MHKISETPEVASVSNRHAEEDCIMTKNRNAQHRDNVVYFSKIEMYRVQYSGEFAEQQVGLEFDKLDAHATLQRRINLLEGAGQ